MKILYFTYIRETVYLQSVVVMKDQIEVKQASAEDAETILQLQMRAYLSEAEIYNDYGIPPLIQSLNEIKQEFSQQVFLKAIEKERDDEKKKEKREMIQTRLRI